MRLPLSTLVLALASTPVSAAPQTSGPPRGYGGGTLLRFGCSQIVIERIDPLVNPGMNPSSHVHQIVGGDAFAATMPHADVAQLANCTTCSYTEDLSNYWTANLYFKARNATYKRVPQVPNRFVDGSASAASAGGR